MKNKNSPELAETCRCDFTRELGASFPTITLAHTSEMRGPKIGKLNAAEQALYQTF